MGLVGADVAHLDAAATAMAPIANQVNGQASAIRAAGSQAAGAAGDSGLGGTITTVAGAVATATRDTGTIVAHLQRAVETSASNVATATAVP